MLEFLNGIHVPAETLWTGAVAILVALLGSSVIAALVNRKKLVADAGLTDTQRQKLQDEISAGLRKDLLEADTNCAERIKLLEAAREQDKHECDERLRAIDQRLTEALTWGRKEADDACEARKAMQAEIDQLRDALATERDLRQHRELEMGEMLDSMERGA